MDEQGGLGARRAIYPRGVIRDSRAVKAISFSTMNHIDIHIFIVALQAIRPPSYALSVEAVSHPAPQRKRKVGGTLNEQLRVHDNWSGESRRLQRGDPPAYTYVK